MRQKAMSACARWRGALISDFFRCVIRRVSHLLITYRLRLPDARYAAIAVTLDTPWLRFTAQAEESAEKARRQATPSAMPRRHCAIAARAAPDVIFAMQYAAAGGRRV